MKTILLPPSTLQFHQSDPTEAIEQEFEASLIPILCQLYPRCRIIPFKPIIYYEGERWKPDIAIVENDYKYWFVIEVETASHSLQKHVLGQVRAFINGDYRKEAIEVLAANLHILPKEAATLVNYIPRYVGVVSNQENSNWTKAIEAENAQHVSISAYADSGNNSQAILVSGRFQTPRNSHGFGQVDAAMQTIRFPKNDFWEKGAYRIIESSGTGTWECFLTDSNAWLTKRRGTIQIKDKKFVQIIEDGGEIFLNELKH